MILVALIAALGAGCPGQKKTKPATPPRTKEAPAVPKVSAARCKVADDCAVRVAEGCCEPCQDTPVSEMISLPSKQWHAREKACVGKRDQGCPKCAAPGYNHNLVSVCEGGQCKAIDFRTSEFSACKTDADCRITAPACCDCYIDPVAVGKAGEEAFHRWACPPNLHCEACRIPMYPGLEAVCKGGHCRVQGTWDKAKEPEEIRAFLGVK